MTDDTELFTGFFPVSYVNLLAQRTKLNTNLKKTKQFKHSWQNQPTSD